MSLILIKKALRYRMVEKFLYRGGGVGGLLEVRKKGHPIKLMRISDPHQLQNDCSRH